MSVAVNVLKWELRYRWIRRKVRLSASGDVPEVATPPGFDEETSEARQALMLCYEILDGLRARERVAFVLRYMEEMTVGEVARTDGDLEEHGEAADRSGRREGLRESRPKRRPQGLLSRHGNERRS